MTSDEMQNFAPLFQNTPLKRQTVITSMTTLPKNSSEVMSISCLIIGTEHGDVYILDPGAFTVLVKVCVCVCVSVCVCECVCVCMSVCTHSCVCVSCKYSVCVSLVIGHVS